MLVKRSPEHVFCLRHNPNYVRDICEALPLPKVLIPVIYVNYITTVTWHLIEQTLLYTFDTLITI